jgi:gliding motility-associated-like protein
MKSCIRILILLITSLLLIINNANSQCITCTSINSLNNGLIWCHPFSGNANDVTGNGYDGFVSGATLIPDRTGTPNSAYNFNGTTSYISISKNIPSTLTTFSISMWLKPGTNSGDGFIFWEGNNICGNDIYLVLQNSTLKLGANKSSSLGGLGNSSHTYTVPSPFLNTWTHVVWVMEPTVSKLYVNGYLAITINSNGNGSGYNYAASYGSKFDGNGGSCGAPRQFYYQGGIDDVRLYNRSLSASEALGLFNITTGNPPILNSLLIDRNICKGDSISVNLTAINANSYLWTPSLGVSNNSILNPYFKPSVSTNYILSLSNNECTIRDTFTINVNTLNIELGPNRNICKGDSIRINPSIINATNFNWTPNIGLSNSSISNPYFKPILTTSYILTASNNQCSIKDTFTININPLNLELGPDKNLCLGDSMQMNPVINNANNLIWSPPINISNVNIATPFVKPSISSKYYLNVSNGTCSLTDSISITINTISLDIGLDKSICLGDSVEINPTAGAGTFVWSPSLGLSSIITKNTIAKPITSTKYYLNHVSGACSLTDSISIAVNSVSVELGVDKGFCLGDSIQLNPQTNNSTIYSWSPTNWLSDPLIKNPFFKPDLPTKYFLAVSNGVCSAIDSIIISPKSISVEAGMDIIICSGDSIKLNAIAGAGIYAWYPKINISDTSISNPIIKPTSDIKYYLKYTEDGCENIDSIFAIVRQISLNLSKNETICLGDSVKILASQTGASNIEWTPAIGLSNTDIIQPWAKPNSTQKYEIQLDDGVCFKSDSLTIYVFDKNSYTNNNDTSICRGNSIQLNILGGTAWNWINPYMLNSNNIPNPIASPQVDTSYIVKISNNNCSIYDTISLKVNQLPAIQAGNDTFHCFNKSVQIFGNKMNSLLTYWEANPYFQDTFKLNQIVSVKKSHEFVLIGEINGCYNYDTILVEEKPQVKADFKINREEGYPPLNIVLNNTSPITPYFNWNFNNNNISTGSNLDTSFIYNKSEDLNIKLTVTDSFGCADTIVKSVKILLKPYFQIPNAFTPNGDGNNDYFQITYNSEAFKYVQYEIYNRWGEHLLTSIFPGGKWWDGYFENSPCQDGVYFYIARGEALDGTIFNSQGTVTLLR